MAIYAELYGVKSILDVAEKLTLYFNKAYQSTFSFKATLKSTAKVLKGLRPTVSLSPDGSLEASLRGGGDSPTPRVEHFFDHVLKLHHEGIKIAIILDEFQDVALADGAEVILREEMQKLPFEIPVIILGSKQHLLAKIFQKPKAPFFNWGKRLEIGPLPIGEYNDYMRQRLADHGIESDEGTLAHIQETLLYNPEAVNMFCSHIVYQMGDGKAETSVLSRDIVDMLLHDYVASRGGEFETYLDAYTKNEIKVLTLIAKKGVLLNPMGKETIGKLRISVSGLRKTLNKFLDHADVYREGKGFVLSKPLLMHYLRDWRL